MFAGVKNMNIGSVKDALGMAGVAKYAYQAGRVAQGMGSTTKATVALDLVSGGVNATTATDVCQALKASSTLAKGISGGTKISNLGKVAEVAGKVAPVVSRGAAALGCVLGGIEVGRGVKAVHNGDKEKGTKQIVSGACDIVTQAASGVSASCSASVVGVPVAAVALGVASAAQAGKYIYKYKDQLGSAAKKAGQGVSNAAHFVGGKLGSLAVGVRSGVAGAAQKIGEGACRVAKAAGAAVAKGAERIDNVFKGKK